MDTSTERIGSVLFIISYSKLSIGNYYATEILPPFFLIYTVAIIVENTISYFTTQMSSYFDIYKFSSISQSGSNYILNIVALLKCAMAAAC